MNRKIQTAKYVISDFVTAALSWALFFIFRKKSIENGTFEDMNAARLYKIAKDEEWANKSAATAQPSSH